MSKRLRTLSGCALFAALACVFLYVSSVIPSGRLAAVAVAGVVTAAAVIHYGTLAAVSAFAVTALLSAAVAPDKGNVILYAAFFGYYPIVKSAIERLKGSVAQWAAKLVLFNAVFCAIWLVGKELLLKHAPAMPAAWLVAEAAANAAFIIFDIGLTKLIAMYIMRVSTHIK